MCVCVWKVNSGISQRRPTLILRKLGGQQALQTNPQYVIESEIQISVRLGAKQVAYRSATLATTHTHNNNDACQLMRSRLFFMNNI